MRPPVNSAAPFTGSTTGGNELFAYIPRGVYANLINLVNPYYNAVHQYFVNGSPQASDVQFADASWHTVLVGTEGAGGNSVYALDVTNPDGITSEGVACLGRALGFHRSRHGLGLLNARHRQHAGRLDGVRGQWLQQPHPKAVPLRA